LHLNANIGPTNEKLCPRIPGYLSKRSLEVVDTSRIKTYIDEDPGELMN
jgi:hypothetical protein